MQVTWPTDPPEPLVPTSSHTHRPVQRPAQRMSPVTGLLLSLPSHQPLHPFTSSPSHSEGGLVRPPGSMVSLGASSCRCLTQRHISWALNPLVPLTNEPNLTLHWHRDPQLLELLAPDTRASGPHPNVFPMSPIPSSGSTLLSPKGAQEGLFFKSSWWASPLRPRVWSPSWDSLRRRQIRVLVHLPRLWGFPHLPLLLCAPLSDCTDGRLLSHNLQ